MMYEGDRKNGILGYDEWGEIIFNIRKSFFLKCLFLPTKHIGLQENWPNRWKHNIKPNESPYKNTVYILFEAAIKLVLSDPIGQQ